MVSILGLDPSHLGSIPGGSITLDTDSSKLGSLPSEGFGSVAKLLQIVDFRSLGVKVASWIPNLWIRVRFPEGAFLWSGADLQGDSFPEYYRILLPTIVGSLPNKSREGLSESDSDNRF